MTVQRAVLIPSTFSLSSHLSVWLAELGEKLLGLVDLARGHLGCNEGGGG